MSLNVLITGGTGAVGRELCEFLVQQKINVSILSRSKKDNTKYKTYTWDLENFLIDKNAFKNCDYIIHLAGAGIADKRWTDKRKKEILNSRVKSTSLLYKALSNSEHQIKGIISASAIGFYGQINSDQTFKETDPPGNDFVSAVCQSWEAEVNRFQDLDLRTINLRIGIVLMKRGGALEKMSMPFRWYLGSVLGSGKQIIPWIHITDLNRIVLQALQSSEMHGPYNCASPQAVSNREFSNQIAEVLGKKIWLPSVPAWALQVILGSRAVLLTKGSNISAEKILKTNFQFKFKELQAALKDLLTD